MGRFSSMLPVMLILALVCPAQGQINQGGLDGEQHNHPSGFVFRAPAGWTLQQQQNFMFFFPPDAQRTMQGPAESVVVFAEPAVNFTGPLDPRLQERLNMQVSQLYPYLQPNGTVQTPIGALYMYAGRNPVGIDMAGHLYVRLENGKAMISLGLAPQNRMQMRRQSFYAINLSSNPVARALPGPQPGALSQELFGFWYYQERKYWEGTGTTIQSQGVDLRPDGRFIIAQKSDFISQNGPDQMGRWQETAQGTWRVQGDELMLTSQGQTLTWRYRFNGNTLIFTDQNGKVYECQRGQYQ